MLALPLAGSGRMTRTVGLVFRVFVAPARMRIGGSPPWNRIARTAFVTHLGRQFADPMLIEQMAQRTHGHLQNIRGVGLVSVGAPQSFEDVSLFQLIEVRREIDPVQRQFQLRRDPRWIVLGDLLRQSLGLDRIRFLQGHRAFDCVFQLAHVTRPEITFQEPQRLTVNRQLTPGLGAELLDKVFGEFRDVRSAYA